MFFSVIRWKLPSNTVLALNSEKIEGYEVVAMKIVTESFHFVL